MSENNGMIPECYELRRKAGWSYYASPEIDALGVSHGFFTRETPSYRMEGEGLRRFLDAFGLERAVVMSQEHGTRVHVIRDAEQPASGDGIVIVEKRGVAGIIKTADCLPVILAAPKRRVAAIVHAGWRGTVREIAGRAVDVMSGIGVRADEITALLGPCIGPCCYEVKRDVADGFMGAGFPPEVVRQRGGSLFLDIRAANRVTLAKKGVNHVYDPGLCTLCSGGFHSYRGGEKEMRQINFVSLR